jgi:hypothetical protein
MTLERDLNQSRCVNGNGDGKYEQLASRLKEITEAMPLEEIERKWGKEFLIYLTNIDNFVGYLRTEKRKIESRREKVPQDFYAQTEGLDLQNLKNWYYNEEGLKNKERRYRRIVYIERLFGLLLDKFQVDIEKKNGRNNNGQIRTSKDLKTLCENAPTREYMLKLCQGDDVVLADIVAVLYDGKITRDDAINFLQESCLRDYLGNFRKPIGIPDIKECAEELLPFDKNNVIAEIIYRRLIELRRNELGPKPSAKKRKAFLEEMRKTLEELV